MLHVVWHIHVVKAFWSFLWFVCGSHGGQCYCYWQGTCVTGYYHWKSGSLVWLWFHIPRLDLSWRQINRCPSPHWKTFIQVLCLMCKPTLGLYHFLLVLLCFCILSSLCNMYNQFYPFCCFFFKLNIKNLHVCMFYKLALKLYLIQSQSLFHEWI